MSDSRHLHWLATKHVLRYLRGTIGYELRYSYVGGVRLFGYIDSDCRQCSGSEEYIRVLLQSGFRYDFLV